MPLTFPSGTNIQHGSIAHVENGSRKKLSSSSRENMEEMSGLMSQDAVRDDWSLMSESI